MRREEDSQWHLDKRVPVALIFTMVLQIAAFAWLIAQIEGRVTVNERDILRITAQVDVQTRAAQTQAIQLGRIEENLAAMRADIARLVRALERDLP